MPHSPSRNLADRFKDNRGYFHQPEALRWGKYALSIVALVAAVGWAAIDVGKPPKSDYSHSHGPLANVHAMWDDNCAACHRVHSSAELGPQSLFQARDRWHDLTCERCHVGAVHHANAKPAGAQFQNDCSYCHHDHGGRANYLTRISDDHCTKCHSNLNSNRATHDTMFAEKVTNFITDHPEFRALILNPPGTPAHDRTLKFSHALHLTPGQLYVPDGKGAMTVEQIIKLSGPSAAERYSKSGQDPKLPIALDCASCHQLDSGVGGGDFTLLKATLNRAAEPTRSILPSRAEGAYFLPVNFEAHCRACHPLKAPDGVLGNERRYFISSFDIPHRKQPSELEKDVRAGYLEGLVTTPYPMLKEPAEPGGLFKLRQETAARTIREEINGLTKTAMSRLLTAKGGCIQCHDLNGTAIAPIRDRTVWFQNAKFNHTAHRGVTCATCHPACGPAFAPGGNVIEKEPVQITGVNSCKACHAPIGTQVDLPGGERISGGGVRHNCIDCHRYHNRDNELQGRGADARKPIAPLSLSEFLSGK